MARIDQWGRWPIILVWFLTALLSLPVGLMAYGMAEETGAELAAAVFAAGVLMLLGGAMKVTWRWLTASSNDQ